MTESQLFVGAVVLQEQRILLVRQSEGHPLQGQWTVPWGRVNAGEAPSVAAIRETPEEGGIEARIVGLLGVQELPRPQFGCAALVYLCEHAAGAPLPRDRETDAAAYFNEVEIDALADPVEPWSNWLVRRVLAQQHTLIEAAPNNPLHTQGSFI